MNELTGHQFWIINVYFAHNGFHRTYQMSQVIIDLMTVYSCDNAEGEITSLIEKNVLSLSPCGYKIKFTDYGLELYKATKLAQNEWEKAPIIKTLNTNHDEILVRAGETFKGNRVLREMLAAATRELLILDPYIGTAVFDILDEQQSKASTRIITSDQASSAVVAAFKAFRNQHGHVDMKTISGRIHDRFIICDRSLGFHIGHSLKDLGTKDTQINRISDPSQQVQMFEERWRTATHIK